MRNYGTTGVACKGCGATVPPNRKVYCSKKCRIRWRNGRTLRVRTSCTGCGTLFMARKQRVRLGIGVFCSNRCHADYTKAAGIRSRERHPHWKGGISLGRVHPMKRAAHLAVKAEVRSGRMIRKPCEKCGSTARIHAHHDDYSRPLDVRWLCPLHHNEHHMLEQHAIDSDLAARSVAARARKAARKPPDRSIDAARKEIARRIKEREAALRARRVANPMTPTQGATR